MSLKAFHVFFVIASLLLTFGFGAWAAYEYKRTGSSGMLAACGAAVVFAGLLGWYFRWFLRKLKNFSYV